MLIVPTDTYEPISIAIVTFQRV